MFDSIKFISDFKISSTTTGKHSRQGWVNVECPLCSGNPGCHGGFNVSDAKFKGEYHCWRCGWQWPPKIISGLLSISIQQALSIYKKYSDGKERKYIKKIKTKEKIKSAKLPPETINLTKKHKQYLEKRKLDPIFLKKNYGLMSTDKWGFYKNRILIPIYYENKLVSYVCRDTTNKAEEKYLSCKEIDESYHHKYILYNLDNAKKYDSCIICEGVFDAWKIGICGVATFGIKYTMPQILLIAKHFKRAFIFFDNDYQAQIQAENLGIELERLNVNVEILVDDRYKDPGGAPKKYIYNTLKTLNIKKR